MYYSIQACRAVAAALVVLYHLGIALAAPKYFGVDLYARLFSFGSCGVMFFFVLSGFIITHVHRQDIGMPGRLPGYLRKRAIRIYPTYWIVLAGVCVLAPFSDSLRTNLPGDAGVIAKTLLLLPQDPLVVGGTGAPVLTVAWSLQYEILFYAFFALLIFRRWLAMIFAGVFAGVYFACLVDCRFPVGMLGDNWSLLFVFGVATAWACASRWRPGRPLLLAAAGTAAFISVAAVEVALGREVEAVDRRLLYGLCSAAIIAGLVKAEDVGQFRSGTAMMSLLGDASYSLYLIHYPLISAMCKLFVVLGLSGTAWATLALVLIFATCIAVALAFNRFVERPMLRYFSTTAPGTSARSRAARPRN